MCIFGYQDTFLGKNYIMNVVNIDRCVLFLGLLILGCLPAVGQEFRMGGCVRFRIGNGTIDSLFGENAARLSEIISLLEKIKSDSTTQLTGVTFSGSVSPDGRADFNRQLAVARMLALEKYVLERVAIPDSIVTRKSNGIAWERLAELVEVSDMPHKEEVLCVLRNVPEAVFDRRGRLVDSRKKQLMELQWGRTWHYLNEYFFDHLRNAGILVFAVRSVPAWTGTGDKSPDMKTVVAPVDTVVVTDSGDVFEVAMPDVALRLSDRKPFYMSFKTNGLYDLLALPNAGVEFYLGRNWSVTANWMYGWWNNNRHHRYWRAYGGDIAVRKWFGRAADEKPLTGHHLGVYGQVLTYDFEFGGKGQLGGEPGKSLWVNPGYTAGVEYGYSLPVAWRLNIDFTVGVGYFGGKYYEYEPIDSHYVWQATKQRHWIGPTKAEISLVWLLGRSNRNEKKGGAK